MKQSRQSPSPIRSNRLLLLLLLLLLQNKSGQAALSAEQKKTERSQRQLEMVKIQLKRAQGKVKELRADRAAMRIKMATAKKK